MTEISRLVILTNGGAYAERILVGLSLAGVIPEAILLVDVPAQSRSSRVNAFKRLLRSSSPRQIVAKAARWTLSAAGMHETRGSRADQVERFAGFARRTLPAGPLNGERMLALMRACSPDYLLLAGAGVVSADALKIPTRGTINVHPGLLPWVRGVGVVEGALLRHLPVGITAHFVSAGIDTGDIIHRELVPVYETDTVSSLRFKTYELCARTMESLASAATRGDAVTGYPQQERYPYCRRPTTDEAIRAASDVRAGLALKLYLRWRGFLGSDVLPRVVTGHPPILIAPVRGKPPR